MSDERILLSDEGNTPGPVQPHIVVANQMSPALKVSLVFCALAVFSAPTFILMKKVDQDSKVIEALLLRETQISAPTIQDVPLALVDEINNDVVAVSGVTLTEEEPPVVSIFPVDVEMDVVKEEVVDVIVDENPLEPMREDSFSPQARALIEELRVRAGTDRTDIDDETYASMKIGYVTKAAPAPVTDGDFTIGDAGTFIPDPLYEVDIEGNIIFDADIDTIDEAIEAVEVITDQIDLNERDLLTDFIELPSDVPVDDLSDQPPFVLSSNVIFHNGIRHHLSGTLGIKPFYSCENESGIAYDCDDWAVTAMNFGIREGDLTCSVVAGAPQRMDGSSTSVCTLKIGDADPLNVSSWSVLAGINTAQVDREYLATLQAQAKDANRGIWSGSFDSTVSERPRARP